MSYSFATPEMDSRWKMIRLLFAVLLFILPEAEPFIQFRRSKGAKAIEFHSDFPEDPTIREAEDALENMLDGYDPWKKPKTESSVEIKTSAMDLPEDSTGDMEPGYVGTLRTTQENAIEESKFHHNKQRNPHLFPSSFEGEEGNAFKPVSRIRRTTEDLARNRIIFDNDLLGVFNEGSGFGDVGLHIDP